MSSYGDGAGGGKSPPQPGDQPGKTGDGRSDPGSHKGCRRNETPGWGGGKPKGKGSWDHRSDKSKGGKSQSRKPDRVAQLVDTVERLAEAVGNLTIASANQASTASSSSSSRQQKSGANPNGTSYANAKRALQKKRSALLKLLDVSAGPDFCWEKEFPDTEATRDRIEKVRTEQPEAYKRLITGIRSAEQKVTARKLDPANSNEQPLQVLPSIFGVAGADGDQNRDAVAMGDE